VTFSLVVSVGTYHFGFDRLMDWTQSWLERHPEAVATVQHGTSRTVPGADNREIIAHPELLDLYRDASVIVLQGGAGGVMDARELGLRPIVVPRIPVDDEVVDEHQIVFGRRLRDLGLVHLAESEAELHELLDQALASTLSVRPEHRPETPGAAAVASALDALMAGERPRRRRRLRAVATPRAWKSRKVSGAD
jgi:UDP-N-acetylglucosamine transferase subunit ALG13